MSTADVLPVVSLTDWDREWAHDDRVHELVRGVPVVAPSERAPNLRAAMRLWKVLDDAVGPEVEGLPGLEVLIHDDPVPTVRRPDLVVLRADPRLTSYRVHGRDVLAAVEVLSSATARIDQTEKVSEYAQVGIPAYVLVDVRNPRAAVLTLYSAPVAGVYRNRVDGQEVIVPIGAGVRIRVEDLMLSSASQAATSSPAALRAVRDSLGRTSAGPPETGDLDGTDPGIRATPTAEPPRDRISDTHCRPAGSPSHTCCSVSAAR